MLLAGNSTEQESLYNNYWVKIENTITNDYISKFARDYLIMNIFDDVADGDIYKMFKSHFNETKATHLDILKEMNELSKYFNWLKFVKSPDQVINQTISYLNVLKTDDLYPLYIYLFNKLYDSDIVELRKILYLLSDFMLRYRIVSPSGGGGAIRSVVHQLLEKLSSDEISLDYESILFELSNSSTVSGRYPDDEEFKQALMQGVNTTYAKVLLLKLEGIETKNIPLPINKVTIEHLMPQTLNDWWINNLGGKEKAELIYEKYIQCIGNLAPLSPGYNSQNSNKPWPQKLNQLKKFSLLLL